LIGGKASVGDLLNGVGRRVKGIGKSVRGNYVQRENETYEPNETCGGRPF